jgi:hypothetical protein
MRMIMWRNCNSHAFLEVAVSIIVKYKTQLKSRVKFSKTLSGKAD